jgi:hypothetical protein
MPAHCEQEERDLFMKLAAKVCFALMVCTGVIGAASAQQPYPFVTLTDTINVGDEA